MAFDTSDGFLRHTGPAGKAILSPKDDGTVKGGTSMGGKANSVRADSGFAGVLETAPPPTCVPPPTFWSDTVRGGVSHPELVICVVSPRVPVIKRAGATPPPRFLPLPHASLILLPAFRLLGGHNCYPPHFAEI